jgi:LacI family transcriptional regulator
LTQATERRVTQFCDEYRARSGAEARRLVTRSPSEAAATDALDAFLKEGGEVDGVFAVHDSLAAGAYLALRRYALAIPQQVRVVGMGDSDWPEFLDPPLSCAGAEESEVYGRAAKMILEACEPGGREPETIHTYARVLARGSA